MINTACIISRLPKYSIYRKRYIDLYKLEHAEIKQLKISNACWC